MTNKPGAWLLDNPRRFTVVVLIVLGALMGTAALAVPKVIGAEDDEPSVAVATSPGPTEARPLAPESKPHESAAPEGETRPAVKRFLTLYLGPTTTEKLQQLRGLATSALGDGLRLAEPKQVPPGPLQSLRLIESGAYSASYLAVTRSHRLRVEVIRESGSWRVSDVHPEEP